MKFAYKILSLVFLTLQILMVSGLICHAAGYTAEPEITRTASPLAEDGIAPKADKFVWKHKTVGGQKYKRLYNLTQNQWAGDWIPA